MTNIKASIIILAAGSSSRLGRNKALIKFEDKTAICHTIDSARKSGVSRILAVLGAEASRVKDEIKDRSVETIINTNYEGGRTGSIKAGLRALGNDVYEHSVIIFPVDAPLVPSEVIKILIQASKKEVSQGDIWVVPEFEGKNGHPILIRGGIIAEILKASDDIPLRDILHKREKQKELARIVVSVKSPRILDNFDEEQDIEKFCKAN